MKKIHVLVLFVFILLIVSACGGSQTNNVVKSSNNNQASPVDEKETDVVETTKETETPPTEEPKEASFKPGDKFNLGTWEITLESFEFNQKVSSDMFSSSADEGNKFIVLNYNVTNNGKEANDFTAMINGIRMKAIFKGEYEYDYTVTMIDGDLSQDSIKPLASKKGFVVIEVPDTVANSNESLVIKLEEEGEKAQITLK